MLFGMITHPLLLHSRWKRAENLDLVTAHFKAFLSPVFCSEISYIFSLETFLGA